MHQEKTIEFYKNASESTEKSRKISKNGKKINDWRKTETNQNTLESYKGVNKKDDFQRALWAKFALFAYYFDLSLGRWAKSEEG